MKAGINMLLAALPLALLAVAVDAEPSAKRGLAFGHHSVEDLEEISRGITWWYNWHYLPDERVRDRYRKLGVEYVPMVWGRKTYDFAGLDRFLAENRGDVKYLLGFNEPNFLEQANMTPSEAAADWKQLEKLADKYDLQLVGPAVNWCGECVSEGGTTYKNPIDYLDDFFDECRDCRVDFIAVHFYNCYGRELDDYLDMFKKYNRPLWVTEFACAYGLNEEVTVAHQARYMKEAIKILERRSDVFRYAWFSGRFPNFPVLDVFGSGSGELTEIGEIYVNADASGRTPMQPGKMSNKGIARARSVSEIKAQKAASTEEGADEGFRSWRDRRGNTLQARLDWYESGKVQLAGPDGKIVVIDYYDLSPADRRFIDAR